MIEIVGIPRDATEEELKQYANTEKEKEKPQWQDSLLRVFLANH